MIELDAVPLALEGKRVRVVIEPVEDVADDVTRALATAPVDDEPATDEEQRRITAWREGHRSATSADELRATIGSRLGDRTP